MSYIESDILSMISSVPASWAFQIDFALPEGLIFKPHLHFELPSSYSALSSCT